jgi:hypothetical protein
LNCGRILVPNLKIDLLKILIIIFVICSSLTFGQTEPDTLQFFTNAPISNLLFSSFEKQLNTYNLNTGFTYGWKAEKFSFEVNQNFKSTLVKTGSKSVKDDHYLYLNGLYNLNERLRIGITGESKILSDDRQLAINQAAINHASVYTEAELIKDLIFTPFVGYSNNRQIGENDDGPFYGIEGYLNELNLTDLSLTSALKFENEDITPRKNTLRYFNLILKNQFNPDVANFLNTKYNRSRKDFYISTDSITSSEFNVSKNIESRTESVFSLDDKLYYNRIFTNTFFELSGGLNWRTIDRDKRYKSTSAQDKNIFDSRIEELRIGIESAINYKTDNFNSSLRLSFTERDEKHKPKDFSVIDRVFFDERSEEEARKNNNSARVVLSLSNDFKISKSDLLSASIFHSKLRYDTPSLNNDDDRDELLTIARIRYVHQLTPYLEMFISTEGTQSHLVYVFASKSANNYINRVLRLVTGGNYFSPYFRSKNSFEVSANYTVYDFEDLTSNLRSISFRQLVVTDSTNWQMSKLFSIIIEGYLKISNQGDLNWQEFKERPSRYIQEIFTDPKFGITFDKIFLAAGIRIFNVRTFKYDGLNRIPDTEYRSIGPLVELDIGSDKLFLKFNSWYEFISDGITLSERVNMFAEMNWKF